MNVFSSLSKYNSATNENYLTESLIFTVRTLLARMPETGLDFVNMLCVQNGEILFNNKDSIKISTQVSTEVGTPDIEIRDENSVVFIEVKHDSPLGADQLESYKAVLDSIEVETKKLVLLTRSRYSFIDTRLDANEYSRIFWYEIHKWLSGKDFDDPVCEFLVDGFVEFLEVKHMSLKKISPEYEDGIPALLNLTEMLRAAIIEVMPGVKILNTGGWNWRGFYLPGEYWFGVRFSENTIVTFEDNRGYDPLTYQRKLNLKDINFFSLDNNRQFELIVEFFKKSVDGLGSLKE